MSRSRRGRTKAPPTTQWTWTGETAPRCSAVPRPVTGTKTKISSWRFEISESANASSRLDAPVLPPFRNDCEGFVIHRGRTIFPPLLGKAISYPCRTAMPLVSTTSGPRPGGSSRPRNCVRSSWPPPTGWSGSRPLAAPSATTIRSWGWPMTSRAISTTPPAPWNCSRSSRRPGRRGRIRIASTACIPTPPPPAMMPLAKGKRC